MSKTFIVCLIIICTLCACKESATQYHLAGVEQDFCVPRARQVHLPLGMFEVSPDKATGFVFTGCSSDPKDKRNCRIPYEISGGVVSPAGSSPGWRWENFSDQSFYHQTLNDLTGKDIRHVTVFDEFNMIRIITQDPGSQVFFWNKAPGRKFRSRPKLGTGDRLMAVCKYTTPDFQHNTSRVAGVRCDRYMHTPKYIVDYHFTLDSMRKQNMLALDQRLIRTIESWKCKVDQ